MFGDDQLLFSGYYAIVGSGAMPKPVHITGKAPAEFTGKGFAASCVIRKTTVEGMLKVEIMNGKEVVSAAETVAPYGIVTLGKIPGTNSLIDKLLGWVMG